MKILSTKVHGMLDYLMGILLIAAPWLLGFNRGGAETYVPVVLGAMMIIYSLMTNYELGAAKVLSMRTHLLLDIVSGLFLAASPWLFNFNEYVYVPHLVLGLLEVGAAAMTEREPSTAHTHGHTRAHA